MVEHTHKIVWPNGEGETPCSATYFNAKLARDDIYEPGRDYEMCLDDFEPEKLEEWNRWDDLMNNLQLNGHTGRSIRY